MQWAHGLGVERHTRDKQAAQATKAQEEDAARASAVSAERWMAIVAGIRDWLTPTTPGQGGPS